MSDAPEKIWVTIGRRGEIVTSPDVHIQPKAEVASAFTEYTRTDTIPSAAYVAGLEAALGDIASALDDQPEYHAQGMGCGLEDRNITDRYAAMAYGWESAMERVYDEHIEFAKDTARAALESRPASPDVRVVTVEQLDRWHDQIEFSSIRKSIRAIIGGQP